MDFSIAEDSKFLSKEGMQITKTFTRRSILGASAIAGTLSATAPLQKEPSMLTLPKRAI